MAHGPHRTDATTQGGPSRVAIDGAGDGPVCIFGDAIVPDSTTGHIG